MVGKLSAALPERARTRPRRLGNRQPARAARPLPPQRAALPPAAGQVHLHFHGVTAEDVAAIIEHHRQDG